jgi:hypothetical protein
MDGTDRVYAIIEGYKQRKWTERENKRTGRCLIQQQPHKEKDHKK